jgi:hypothetical protein
MCLHIHLLREAGVTYIASDVRRLGYLYMVRSRGSLRGVNCISDMLVSVCIVTMRGSQRDVLIVRNRGKLGGA